MRCVVAMVAGRGCWLKSWKDGHDHCYALFFDVAGQGCHSWLEVGHHERERDALDSGRHAGATGRGGGADAGDQVLAVEPFQDGEAGRLGEPAQFVGRDEEALRGPICPGHRVVEIASLRAAHDLEERQSAAVFEHPMHLAEHRLLVVDVRPDGLRPDHVELAVVDRHLPCIATDDLDLVVEPAAAAELLVEIAEPARRVERRHERARMYGERTRRAADAGAYVEHALASGDRSRGRPS